MSRLRRRVAGQPGPRWALLATTGSAVLPVTGAQNALPSLPGQLTAVMTQTTATLSWTAATDPDGFVAGYRVQVDGGPAVSVTGLGYVVSGLAAGSTHTFTVAAVDDLGGVGAAAQVTATTQAAATTQAPPRTLSAQVTTTTVTLSWQAPTSGAPAGGYRVYQAGTLVGSGSATTQLVSGLAASTAYSFAVEAVAADGTSSQQVAVHVTTASPSAVAGGWEITADNTGVYGAFDPALGRNVAREDLQTVTTPARASDYVQAGGTIRRRYFAAGFLKDVPCTVLECFVVGSLRSSLAADVDHLWDWCTADASSIAPTGGYNPDLGTGLYGGKYTANRCKVLGNDDGSRGGGVGCTITESFVRLFGHDPQSHSDGFQWYDPGASGLGEVHVERSNVDCRPTNGVGNANAALFAADGTASTMPAFYWRDNLLRGGAITVRCNDGGTFHVTGNRVVDDGQAPAGVFGAASIVEWAENILVTPAGAVLATIAQPT